MRSRSVSKALHIAGLSLTLQMDGSKSVHVNGRGADLLATFLPWVNPAEQSNLYISPNLSIATMSSRQVAVAGSMRPAQRLALRRDHHRLRGGQGGGG